MNRYTKKLDELRLHLYETQLQAEYFLRFSSPKNPEIHELITPDVTSIIYEAKHQQQILTELIDKINLIK